MGALDEPGRRASVVYESGVAGESERDPHSLSLWRRVVQRIGSGVGVGQSRRPRAALPSRPRLRESAHESSNGHLRVVGPEASGELPCEGVVGYGELRAERREHRQQRGLRHLVVLDDKRIARRDVSEVLLPSGGDRPEKLHPTFDQEQPPEASKPLSAAGMRTVVGPVMLSLALIESTPPERSFNRAQ